MRYRGYLLQQGMPSRLTGEVGIFYKGHLITTSPDTDTAKRVIDDWMNAP